MRKSFKTFLSAALIAAMTLSLAACGEDGENGENASQSGTETPEWVYVPEYVELPEDGSYYNMQIEEDHLYYSSYSWDEETGSSVTALNKYSLADGSVETLPLDLGEGSLNSFRVGEDGSVYAMVYFWNMDEATGEYNSWQSLMKWDASGTEVYSLNLTELQEQEGISYFGSIATDAQGRVYMSCDNQIALVDAEGNFRGTVSLGSDMNSWISNIGSDKDGKVYASAYANSGNSGGYKLYEIDFDKKSTGAVYENIPSGNGNSLSVGIEKDFLFYDGTTVYEYDKDAQTAEELFQWLDSDINGQYVDAVGVTPEGKILVVINDWNTGENSMALLTKTPGSEVIQKETIVLGTMQASSELLSAAVNFNKSNDKYRISIKTYVDNSNWNENTWSDALTRLNNDLTSANCPDLIDVSSLNVEQLAAKGVFEDITPYLESSSVIAREDYIENVLAGFTFDDVLIGIPKNFSLQTVAGNAAELGTEMGWSLEEMIAYADAHPDGNLFNYVTKSNIMYYCMMYNENAFIDWKTGECNFDSPEFISLLEFVNRFPEEADYSDERSEPSLIESGEVLLYNAYIYDFEEVQMINDIFGGRATFIGYPTIDGSVGCAMQSSDVYAIAAKSANKDGAWAFLENYLGTEVTNRWFWGFPSNRKQLENQAEKAVAVETYTWTDEDGVEHEEVVSGGSSVTYGDGWTYEYHTPTQEEVDQILALIEVASPAASQNSEIMTIISEEAEAFYKGQKSAEEVAAVIQSRAQIYVSENS